MISTRGRDHGSIQPRLVPQFVCGTTESEARETRPKAAQKQQEWPFQIVITLAFGFTIAAMLVPLLSEFDVALGRTTGGGE